MNELEIKMGDLLDTYPKSCEIITQHFLKVMIESFNDETVPEEFKQAMRDMGLPKERLTMIISGQPRCLFDVFDENEIFIEIYRTAGETFTFNIETFMDHPGSFKSRKECEIVAIKEAFILLEKK